MNAYEIKIECEEDGFHLVIDGDSPDPEWTASILDYRIEDPEKLYEAVKAAIGPWLAEKQSARLAFLCSPEDIDESGGLEDRRVVAIREDGSYRYEPDCDPEPYDISDPKHPEFHSVHADIWDSRAGK